MLAVLRTHQGTDISSRRSDFFHRTPTLTVETKQNKGVSSNSIQRTGHFILYYVIIYTHSIVVLHKYIVT